ncbi:MAG: copper amine oxidase N-terminal domain-containing protein [Clostridia bacterium]|nr:copper amine oxidase N-terminal domain-containing protein [Clostridia bacterium]
MMKKIVGFLIATLLMISLMASTVAFANDEIKVSLNGNLLEFDVSPQIIDGRTMVPLRTIFEALGATVSWNPDTQTVYASKDNTTVSATIGLKKMYINATEMEIDVAPVIVDNRTLVPARFVAEAFDCSVSWDADSQTVIISERKFLDNLFNSHLLFPNANTGSIKPDLNVFDDEQVFEFGASNDESDNCDDSGIDAPEAKPIIYLYPVDKTEVNVKLDYDGELTTTYPEYNDGWNVTAYPDGTLVDSETSKEYYALFWEGINKKGYDMSKGFVVKGSETAEFLEDVLSKQGLTAREANEFIIYWLPKMENNEYNLISFQGKSYTDRAKLDITPNPDSVLRVFMAWKAIDEAIEIEPQIFEAVERTGFTVVEWGGAEIQ